jgi:hypothetical protein
MVGFAKGVYERKMFQLSVCIIDASSVDFQIFLFCSFSCTSAVGQHLFELLAQPGKLCESGKTGK